MLKRVLQTIQTYHMLLPKDKVIIGLSGGADSVVLLHVLKELKEYLNIELFAAHLNHGLRGQVAKEDADFAQNLCNDWSIPFFLKEVDIPSLAQDFRKSEEETGRMIRYGFFQDVMEKVNGGRIATAHHKNDQAETILHNLIRGTGMQGLTGIQPIRSGILIRPLLEVSRQEVMDYIRLHKLPWREDASNKDVTYTRNRIRNQLIPTLVRDFNPEIIDSLTRMAGIIREEEDFLSGYVQSLFDKCAVFSSDKVVLDVKAFLTNHIAIQKRLIRIALHGLRGNLVGVSFVHVEAVLRLAAVGRTGSKTIIPSSRGNKTEVLAEISYGSLMLRKGEAPVPLAVMKYILSIPGQVKLEDPAMTVVAERWDIIRGLTFSPQCIYINEDRIKGRLQLRQRKNGDRFKPLGMKGTKKLKDFFIDRKIPAAQRDQVPLLVDEENIIWVVGFQMNQDYRVTKSSGNIVKISIQNHDSNGG